MLKNQNAYKSGFDEHIDLKAYDLSSSLTQSSFKINLNNKPYQININLPKHLINNV